LEIGFFLLGRVSFAHLKLKNWRFLKKNPKLGLLVGNGCFLIFASNTTVSGLKNLQNIKPFFCSQQSPLASSSACVSEKMEKEGAGFYF
jgi:hypothetical protein